MSPDAACAFANRAKRNSHDRAEWVLLAGESGSRVPNELQG
jgi:hypothetical protein